jgi:hypothetical protein
MQAYLKEYLYVLKRNTPTLLKVTFANCMSTLHNPTGYALTCIFGCRSSTGAASFHSVPPAMATSFKSEKTVRVKH